MKLINNLFIFYPPIVTGKNKYFYRLASFFKLKQPDMKYTAVVIGREAEKYIRKEDMSWDKIYNLIDIIEIEKSDFSYSELQEIENEVFSRSLNEVFEHAKIMFGFPFQGRKYDDFEKDQLLYGFIKAWMQILEENPGSLIIDEGVAGLFSILYELSLKYNSIVFNMTVSRTDNYFVFTHKGYAEWEKLESSYKNNSFPNSREKARDFYLSFIKENIKPKWFYKEHRGKTSRVKKYFMYLPRVLKEIVLYLFYQKHVFLPNIILIHLRSLFSVTDVIHRRFVHWHKIDSNDKYFIYPLHVEPEATVNLVGAYFSNQFEIIRKISIALPIGFKLYVKEHPAFIGKRELGYYKRIKELKNVKLINPFVSSDSLIEKSYGIVIISGTMGFEAIIRRKPIIAFGEAFYKNYKYTYKVNDVKELNKYILQCIEDKERISEHDVIRFLQAYFTEVYRGNVYFNKDSEAFSEENLADVYSAYQTELEYVQKKYG